MNKMRFESSEKKRKKDNYGFYVALGLCICAVGAVGWTVFGSDSDKVNQSSVVYSAPTAEVSSDTASLYTDAEAPVTVDSQEPESAAETGAKATESEENAPVKKTNEVYEDDMGAKQVVANADSTSSSAVYTLPVTGELLKPFSGEELVYCETMGDWRVHNGIDIGTAKGTKVKTAAAGKVLDVYTDELYATTAVILHDGKLTVYYSGLAENLTVKKGDTIEAGTVIGAADGIPCEGALDCHIHLAAKKDGAFVDPVKEMSLKFK